MVGLEDGIPPNTRSIVPIAAPAGPACIPVLGPVGPARRPGLNRADRTGRPEGHRTVVVIRSVPNATKIVRNPSSATSCGVPTVVSSCENTASASA
jgi:hypothetical protein